MQPVNVLVIDGQGGGLGRQLVAALSAQCPEAQLTAVGTNSLAANAMLKAGAQRAATGENAAWGETTPEKVVADWMASEGHRVNIMDPAAKYMCLGYNYDANSQWGHNWIQIFAK